MLDELKDANEYIIKKIEKKLKKNNKEKNNKEKNNKEKNNKEKNNKEKDIVIKELEIYAEKHNIPIVTKEVAEYLKFMIRTRDIKNILEIGTAIGYSGILMASEIEKRSGTLTTIEIDEERFDLAKSNFKKANLDNIKAIKGDAVEEIKKLNDRFDFVFIDASKGHYMEFFNDSFKLLNEGGIIFIDNIMFRGYLYKEYPKRFKTIVKRLDEFIDYLYDNHDVVLLPFGDGCSVIFKPFMCI